MAPFFVCVYYLINEAAKPHYDLVVVNLDRGTILDSKKIELGREMIREISNMKTDSLDLPFSVSETKEKSSGGKMLEERKADAMIVIPADFSERLMTIYSGADLTPVNLEISGDLTNINYMVTAIWGSEFASRYIFRIADQVNPVKITEIPLGISGKLNDFDLYMPGILVLSVIMLMFSATIAIITEAENKTMIRLKMSAVRPWEFLTGVSVVQVGVGLLSAVLTFGVAILLGFHASGSTGLMLLIIVLTSISIIAFSLIIAALCRTATEVLIIGNFPLLLFMFFTGAAFPMEGMPLATVAGYPLTIQGLMSPVHAISALKKVLVFNMEFRDVIPEIACLLILTLIYFMAGLWFFARRHMRIG
jgi:ABC-2 type transport system permease protein